MKYYFISKNRIFDIKKSFSDIKKKMMCLIPTLIPTKEDDAATDEQKSELASYLVAN